jgi:hypothetical protein
VYGSGGDILRTIKNYIKTVDPQTLDKRLFRLFVERNSDPQVNTGTLETTTTSNMGKSATGTGSSPKSEGEDTSSGLTSGAIAGIVISAVALAVGVGGFLYFQSKRRAKYVNAQAGSQVYLEDGHNLISGDGDHSTPTIVVANGRPMLPDGIDEEYWEKTIGRCIT